MFAFTAIGYAGKSHNFGNLPQNVIIMGRVYHQMLDLDLDQGVVPFR